MSNISGSWAAIESYFSSSWAGGSFKTVPVFYSEDVQIEPNNTEWVALNVLWGSGERSTLAPNNIESTKGTLSIAVFVPRGLGITTLLTGSLLADEVRRIIRSGSLTDIRFDAPSDPVDVPNDPKWYQANVSADFVVDETP